MQKEFFVIRTKEPDKKTGRKRYLHTLVSKYGESTTLGHCDETNCRTFETAEDAAKIAKEYLQNQKKLSFKDIEVKKVTIVTTIGEETYPSLPTTYYIHWSGLEHYHPEATYNNIKMEWVKEIIELNSPAKVKDCWLTVVHDGEREILEVYDPETRTWKSNGKTRIDYHINVSNIIWE